MLIQESEIQQVANETMNMLHEGELELINEFYAAVIAKDIDKIDELYVNVLAEMEAHFKVEEDMMEQTEYHSFKVHKADHDMMLAKVQKFHKRWEILKGPKELRGFLEKDLKKWMIQHIGKWDSQTAQHISA